MTTRKAFVSIDVDKLAFEKLIDESWGAIIPLKNSSDFIMYFWDGVGYLSHDFDDDQILSKVDPCYSEPIRLGINNVLERDTYEP